MALCIYLLYFYNCTEYVAFKTKTLIFLIVIVWSCFFHFQMYQHKVNSSHFNYYLITFILKYFKYSYLLNSFSNHNLNTQITYKDAVRSQDLLFSIELHAVVHRVLHQYPTEWLTKVTRISRKNSRSALTWTGIISTWCTFRFLLRNCIPPCDIICVIHST